MNVDVDESIDITLGTEVNQITSLRHFWIKQGVSNKPRFVKFSKTQPHYSPKVPPLLSNQSTTNPSRSIHSK